MLVVVRAGRDLFGVLSPQEAFQVASVGYIAALFILAQIAYILRYAAVKT
jgi:hypothetical protein